MNSKLLPPPPLGSCSKLRPEYAIAWIEDVDITTHDISEE